MQRYRSYGQEDDTPLEEGDRGFVGVNQYDTPENLQPGQVQAAINIDFTDFTAKTRGGLVCLPALGINPFDSTWLPATSSNPSSWTSIIYAKSQFVAVAFNGAGNRVMTSPDGITWTDRVAAAASGWKSITYGSGLYVSVNTDGTTSGVMTSSDGITWNLRTSPVGSWISVCFGNGLFVAVDNSGISTNVMTSTDGITWSAVTTGNTKLWSSVAFGNSTYVAVSAFTGDVMTSPDGSTWTLRTPSIANSWASVTYGGGLFVAVAQSGTANTLVMTSPDGITWTTRTSAANNTWNGVCYGGGLFVAVASSGAGNRVMTSPDGITWTIGTSGENNSLISVTFGFNRFVAVSSNGTHQVQYLDATRVYASGSYSDPNSTSTPWIVLAGPNFAGFYSFGQTARSISYPSGYTINQQSTIVQANNLLFIFSGPNQSPIQWDGTWGGAFVTCPVSTLGVGYENIPFSNQATYYQNRLWAMQGKDTIAASQALDFANFNVLSAVFNLNVGTSDYVVSSYPFGNNSLVVFKNRSSYLLQNVQGALSSVTSTEITRQLGIIGINACTAVGPDIIYMSSDRNITSVRLNIQNATQSVTVPISRNINPIMKRVNWAYGYKVSMGYWNNLLFVALPLDNSTTCNTIIVYNFITEQWYGEWSFDVSLNLAIQGFVTANYLGQARMHVVTEDGRIFVADEGQNDISGTTVAEISTSVTTRAYRMDNNNNIGRRMYADLSTNRPNFSVTSYSDGASESSAILTNQTYSRTSSWIFNDSTYTATNANDDYNRAGRQDYSTGPNSIQCGAGFQPEMTQDYRFPIITRRKGRLSWLKVTNSTGFIRINGVGIEARAGDRSSLVQVI